jgi:hypothetical protein
MKVQPVAFTASGIVGTAAFSGTTLSAQTDSAYAPFGSTSATVAVPQQPEQVVGIAYKGFTQVIVHNGSDATGDVVAVCGGPGTYSWNYEVNCQKGIFLECTGTGSGSIWLA